MMIMRQVQALVLLLVLIFQRQGRHGESVPSQRPSTRYHPGPHWTRASSKSAPVMALILSLLDDDSWEQSGRSYVGSLLQKKYGGGLTCNLQL